MSARALHGQRRTRIVQRFLYSHAEVHILRFIKRARDLGFSTARIEQLVRLWRDQDRASAEVKRLADEHIDELQRKISELEGMKRTLEHLARHCHGDHRPECPIIDDLASDPLAAQAPEPDTR